MSGMFIVQFNIYQIRRWEYWFGVVLCIAYQHRYGNRTRPAYGMCGTDCKFMHKTNLYVQGLCRPIWRNLFTWFVSANTQGMYICISKLLPDQRCGKNMLFVQFFVPIIGRW